MAQEKLQLPHRVVLSEGSSLTVTGVSEVAGLDETVVELTTPLGTLWVQGEGLKLRQLSPEQGQLQVSGRITGLQYTQGGSRRRGRLFG